MISMQGVPSSLILRNESWVRKQAQAMARRLPSNVEKADLIQVGLIAVAQSALAFVWEGDRETEEAKEAFVRYARQRVKGAMLDELRQMDHLGRAQRRKVKVIQVAQERFRASHGTEPSTAELSDMCGLSVEEIFQLELAAHAGQTSSAVEESAEEEGMPHHEMSTAKDEVEARVDTAILMRRLEKFFAALPARDRQVIDAYLGVGMTPVELAQSMKISPSRVSQLFRSICERVGVHLGHTGHRSTDRARASHAEPFEELVSKQEAQAAWGGPVEKVFAVASSQEEDDAAVEGEPIVVTSTTRWG
jgi:RNA polymerase sigma factor for flagellar operon FliA